MTMNNLVATRISSPSARGMGQGSDQNMHSSAGGAHKMRVQNRASELDRQRQGFLTLQAACGVSFHQQFWDSGFLPGDATIRVNWCNLDSGSSRFPTWEPMSASANQSEKTEQRLRTGWSKRMDYMQQVQLLPRSNGRPAAAMAYVHTTHRHYYGLPQNQRTYTLRTVDALTLQHTHTHLATNYINPDADSIHSNSRGQVNDSLTYAFSSVACCLPLRTVINLIYSRCICSQLY